MNKQLKFGIIAVVIGGSICFSSNIFADEKTGREFSELVKELNQELNTAKQKVEKIEEQRLAQKKSNPVKVLPARAEALEKLDKLSKRFDNEKSTETKKKLSKEIEGQVLKVAELSTDFLESMKNDLLSQDKQLEIIEESLSDVIIKMGKLQKLAVKGNGNVSPELTKYRARKSLFNLAQMVELFAEKHKNAQQWSAVRRTIMLQDAILRRSTLATDKIQKLLDAQKKLYEQVLAQVTIARRGLQSEKEILAQVGLGEIAKSMLRKAAGLLLGSQSITQIGEAAFVKSEIRQQQILTFLEQDQDGGLYTGMSSGATNQTASVNYPKGYKEYLAKGID
jgi:hypothetical protein